MKRKLLTILACAMACMTSFAQHKQVEIYNIEADIEWAGCTAYAAIDGDLDTYWLTDHPDSTNRSNPCPLDVILTFEKVTHVDFVRYTPPPFSGFFCYGSWEKVNVAYSTTTDGEDFISIGQFTLPGEDQPYEFILTNQGIDCRRIKFTITRTAWTIAGAAEIEAFAYETTKEPDFASYFTDALCTQLKPEVTSSEGIEDEEVKALVDQFLTDAEGYKKFRVGEYEAYMTLETIMNTLKLSNEYNRYENPTGVYFHNNESYWVIAEGITDGYNVGLKLRNWVTNDSETHYSLRNGLNYFKTTHEGNVFVDYYTDDFETMPKVKLHFINAPVIGYWDQATMTNEDWKELLKGPEAKDNVILITRSEHAQLAFPVSAWRKHCPTNVDSTMTLYQQVQWAQRDMLGLERYGRQLKNRQLFYASTSGFMAAMEDGAKCHIDHLGPIMVPDAAKFDFWGVGHEWGHHNQVRNGFKWSGCGETTNNIYASWGQLLLSPNRNYLRLEDEVSGVGEYAKMRGGRMQVYFEEGVRKGVPWQLQDGPDFHGETPTHKYGNDKLSRNYDHFVKLVPFWQLNLWGTMAEKSPYIITKVIESIRTASNSGTNGQQQINWMKLACDSAKLDLLPFFEKAGMLRPINAYIDDHQPGWNIITEEMIAGLKAYVKEQGYPAVNEEINYVNGHNYPIYRDCLKLEAPAQLNVGCEFKDNKVTVLHNTVKNAVAFETYNAQDSLLRITMYGLGSNDQHEYTQVLYPEDASYIMAVGYNGERIKIFEKAPAGIENLTATLSVQCKEGQFIISGLSKGTVVSLYDVVGKQVATATASEATVTIHTSLSKGSIAILKIGGNCKKVYIE